MLADPMAPPLPSAASSEESSWKRFAAAGAIVLAAVLAYFNSFEGPFVFDDLAAIVDNPTLRHWKTALFPPANSGMTVSGRPGANFSFALNYAFGGLDPRGYHVANLAIHTLAGLVLFGIVRRTLRRTPYASAALPLALGNALLWVTHPLQTESVTYIVQRSESLAGLCYLLTLYAFIRGVESQKAWRWWTIAALANALGMATKEIVATAPLMVWLYDRTFVAGNFRDAWRQRWKIYVALAAGWLALAAVMTTSGSRGGTAGFGMSFGWRAYALKQCEAVVHYLRLAFWPTPLVLDYGGPVLVSRASKVLPHALLLTALLAGVVVALRRRPALGFVGAWFFVILAPSSSVVPLADTMFEHRIYLSLAAVTVFVTAGLHHLFGRCALAAAAAIAAALGVVTHQRNEVYRTEIGLWNDTLNHRPENVRARYTLASALFAAGRTNEAVAQYEEALAREPNSGPAHNNYGNALMQLGRIREAVPHYEAALRVDHRSADTHNNLGNALVRLGRGNDARSHYEEALRLRPAFADAHNNLGNLFAQRGDFPAAAEHYRAALALRPDLADAEANLGNVLAQTGHADEALPHYATALRLRPDFVDAHFNRGIALTELRRWREAIAEFEAVLQLRPTHAGAREHLDTTRLRLEISGGK